MNSGIVLDNEQRAVVDEDSQKRILVTAGAGTGKTLVLVNRLAKLVNEGVAPGSEVRVLTFTRAASGELRKRLTDMSGDVTFVNASTFDSFVTMQLNVIDSDGDWHQQDYDGRIEVFLKALEEENPGLDGLRSRTKHILIDEVQDLVGVRARMVIALLKTIDCGFTLFGDPAQGIYDFQEQNKKNPFLSRDFYDVLKSDFQDLSQITLGENHRAQHENAMEALWAGKELNFEDPDYSSIHSRLTYQLEYSTDTAPSYTIFARAQGTTAILATDNWQVLRISEQLHNNAIPHNVVSRDNDIGVVSWLGAVLSHIKDQTIRIGPFKENIQKLNELGIVDIPDPDDAWEMFQAFSQNHGVVQLQDVRKSLIDGRVPEGFEKKKSDLVVSTIHGAKGLEFDQVIVVPPGDSGKTGDVADLAKILFVAMSRHKRNLFKGSIGYADDRKQWWQNKNEPRFIKHRWGKTRLYSTIGLEIRSSDVNTEEPPGFEQGCDMSPEQTQEFILSKLVSGDKLDMILEQSEEENYPRYNIIHRDSETPVGVASEDFMEYLRRRLSDFKDFMNAEDMDWPTCIEGIRVESIDTVAGKQMDLPDGFGKNGIWNRVRVSGLAEVHYSHSKV